MQTAKLKRRILIATFAYVSSLAITASNVKRDWEIELCVSDLPAMISENTKMVTARRIILTTFRVSSTPVMRMLMTMLLRLRILATDERRLSNSLILTDDHYVAGSSDNWLRQVITTMEQSQARFVLLLFHCIQRLTLLLLRHLPPISKSP